MLKFLVDENISKLTIIFLRSLGYDVKSVGDCKLLGSDDIDILRKASLEARIIITHNTDFGNLVAHPVYYTGVIILRLNDQTPKNTNKYLDKFLKSINLKDLNNSLAIITEEKIRLRPLK